MFPIRGFYERVYESYAKIIQSTRFIFPGMIDQKLVNASGYVARTESKESELHAL